MLEIRSSEILPRDFCGDLRAHYKRNARRIAAAADKRKILVRKLAEDAVAQPTIESLVPERGENLEAGTWPFCCRQSFYHASQDAVDFAMRRKTCWRIYINSPLRAAHRILREVASETGVSTEQILSVRRMKPIVMARRLALYRVYHGTKWSLPQIGRFFGLDHTSVLYAVRKHAAKMAACGELGSAAE